jgi:hypothetical protein
MVFSVQRHGARNVLPKTSGLQESSTSGGPTLLPQGMRQAYDVGVAFRARYLNVSTCSETCLAGMGGVAGAVQALQCLALSVPPVQCRRRLH